MLKQRKAAFLRRKGYPPQVRQSATFLLITLIILIGLTGCGQNATTNNPVSPGNTGATQPEAQGLALIMSTKFAATQEGQSLTNLPAHPQAAILFFDSDG